VQGVGFRYFAQRAAAELGLTGYSRNLDDGRVEVYAAGPEEKLSQFAGMLHQGPQWAEVRGMEELEAEVQDQTFRIGHGLRRRWTPPFCSCRCGLKSTLSRHFEWMRGPDLAEQVLPRFEVQARECVALSALGPGAWSGRRCLVRRNPAPLIRSTGPVLATDAGGHTRRRAGLVLRGDSPDGGGVCIVPRPGTIAAASRRAD
jgi:acylphosphatase